MSERERSGAPFERTYRAAQIFALILMPVALAVIGWITQKSITETAVRKDYVQMALQVLREPRKEDDEEIRALLARSSTRTLQSNCHPRPQGN